MVPDINLLPRIDRKSENNRLLFIITGILFALILIILLFQYFSLMKSVNGLQAEKQLLEERKNELAAEVEVLEQPKAADLATSVRFIESKTYLVSPLLKDIHLYTTNESYLREFVFAENEITIDVDMETMAEVATYVGELDGSSYFTDIKVEEINTFDPVTSEEGDIINTFSAVERFANKFTVVIDPNYLRTGGVVQ
ncbi:PilN domain-containing protein [Sporosarcina siberiensis]|uniref:PilN domain-containing protein n=1 Tax=Sporosarcina siberiensis TaxID=1365606 RepID=A0ABW4SCT7_9BACL